MVVVEMTPRLVEQIIDGKRTGLFVFDGLQRNSPGDRGMLEEIIKEHLNNDHSPKLPASERK